MDARTMSGRQTSSSSSARTATRCRVFNPSAEGAPSPAWRFPTIKQAKQDWRAFRARLVAWEQADARTAEQPKLKRPIHPQLVCGESWAHLLPEPEQGCLLLARNTDQHNMHFYNGAVILITSHDEVMGSVGYLLNKPSPLTVNELQVLGAAAGFKEAFGSQRLHLGGPVHIDHVTLLHRFMGISRSYKVAEGVFMGGLPDAIRLVDAGLAAPSDFQLVLGMSGWSKGQLQQEIDAGNWHVVSASPDLVLPPSPGAVSVPSNAAPPPPAAAQHPRAPQLSAPR
ncbi:hypothetical protein TSOC_006720, partial [Tetrabaena socialis]